MINIFNINRIIITILFFTYIIQLSAAFSFWQWAENNITTRVKRQSDCEFRCDNGQCIRTESVCDGNADCEDRSDETKAKCGNVTCAGFLFQCKYGACIAKSKVCDGERDCVDYSDEETPGCAPIATAGNCKNSQFRCQNGECIYNLEKCDGVKTCADGSDETETECAGLVCPAFLYRCAYGACVTKSARCNGRNDCVDGSDERGCPGSVTSTSVPSTSVTPTPTPTYDSNGCILPAHLGTGRYSYRDPTYPDGYVENSYTDSSTSIILSCNQGYRLSGAPFFYCLNKVWFPDPNTASCTRQCDSLPSTDTYNSFCYLNSQKVSCENPVEGTTVKIQCKPFYVFRGTRIEPSCRNGDWNFYPEPCEPVPPTPVTPTPTPTPDGNGCILPAHLGTGKYSFLGWTYPYGYEENGYATSSTSIILNCNEGYRVVGTPLFYCLKNEGWFPDLNTGSCIQECESLPSTDTYNSYCYVNGRKVSCENPVEGTTVRTRCKPFYVFHGTRINPLCKNGAWDHIPSPCEPECGKKIVEAERLVIGGSDAAQGEYPWMVAVYNTSESQKKHICGASLISRFFVVSAAHCFADAKGEPYPMEYFTVVAGKYKRDLDIAEGTMQVRQLKRLIVHEDYKGNLQKYRDDIALVEVDRFELTLEVQPVCLDWDNTYEDLDLVEENVGVVAGWGFMREGSQPAEILKKLLVPFRSKDICKKYMDPEFYQQYYASDKICAGFKENGTSVCSGDSGGGLYFRSTAVTFYVRGIVSLTRRASAGCDSNHYALYTKVSKYLTWIESITRRRM